MRGRNMLEMEHERAKEKCNQHKCDLKGERERKKKQICDSTLTPIRIDSPIFLCDNEAIGRNGHM